MLRIYRNWLKSDSYRFLPDAVHMCCMVKWQKISDASDEHQMHNAKKLVRFIKRYRICILYYATVTIPKIIKIIVHLMTLELCSYDYWISRYCLCRHDELAEYIWLDDEPYMYIPMRKMIAFWCNMIILCIDVHWTTYNMFSERNDIPMHTMTLPQMNPSHNPIYIYIWFWYHSL